MSTDHPDPHAPEDPILEARIQHALSPYIGRLTPKALAEARRLLNLVLTTHPVAAPLMNRLRERIPPGKSGVKRRSDSEETTTEPEAHAESGGDNRKGRGAR